MRRIVAFAFLAALISPVFAQEHETVVKQPDGATVTVRTDESGTTVIKDTPAQAAAVPISPNDQQHTDKVYQLTREGGKVLSDSTSGK